MWNAQIAFPGCQAQAGCARAKLAAATATRWHQDIGGVGGWPGLTAYAAAASGLVYAKS
jgi:hypothetical protein